MKAFVTVIGKDKVGIIHDITSVFKEADINVLDVNQTLLGGFFTMIMLVDLDNMKVDFGELKLRLEAAGQQLGLSVRIQRKDIFNSMHKI
jgi:ACT domain-containing protein